MTSLDPASRDQRPARPHVEQPDQFAGAVVTGALAAQLAAATRDAEDALLAASTTAVMATTAATHAREVVRRGGDADEVAEAFRAAGELGQAAREAADLAGLAVDEAAAAQSRLHSRVPPDPDTPQVRDGSGRETTDTRTTDRSDHAAAHNAADHNAADHDAGAGAGDGVGDDGGVSGWRAAHERAAQARAGYTLNAEVVDEHAARAYQDYVRAAEVNRVRPAPQVNPGTFREQAAEDLRWDIQFAEQDAYTDADAAEVAHTDVETAAQPDRSWDPDPWGYDRGVPADDAADDAAAGASAAALGSAGNADGAGW